MKDTITPEDQTVAYAHLEPLERAIRICQELVLAVRVATIPLPIRVHIAGNQALEFLQEMGCDESVKPLDTRAERIDDEIEI